MMLFLLEFLVSAADLELDIKYGSVFISGVEDDEYLNLKYNNLDIQILKSDDILIKGSSPNNFINISVTDRINSLSLIFESFTISNEDSAIFILGECTVNISIGDNVSISSLKSHPIFVSNNSELHLESQNKQRQLNIISGPNCSLIGGNGNIYLKNISFDLQQENFLQAGFQGQIINLNSCSINLSTYEQAIGSTQTSLIVINSSYLYLSSQNSSCIGGSENSDLKISIESSTVIAVTSSNNSPCIGNNHSGPLSSIDIKKSNIKSTINSDDSTFSVLGSSSFIQIHSSSLELEATKGSAIGGGFDDGLYTTIEIFDSTVAAFSNGDSATIGGGSETEMKVKIIIKENSIVNATNFGQNGAAIGGGPRTNIDSIFIENSVINCSSFFSGSAIGSGNPNGGSIVNEITIESSQVFAQNRGKIGQQCCGAGIGGNLRDFVKISNSNVTVIGGYSSSGIGGSTGFSVGDIVIINCNVSASSVVEGAAIGASCRGEVNNITIIDSSIDAFSGRNEEKEEAKSAAIGGGYLSSSKLIIIKNSIVKAVSGWSSSAAGIGGGQNGLIEMIEIEDSHVVAISSLDSSRCSHKNNGGAGIGTGSSTGEKSEENKATIRIKNSFVSSFGSNIHIQSEVNSPLLCGAAIGHSGFDNTLIDIFVVNSTIFAYGGNATSIGSAASSAFLGGLEKNSEKITIDKSNIFAVPGSAVSKSSMYLTSSFGKNFIPILSELSGQISIENSDIQSVSVNDAKNDYLSVVFNKFSLTGSSNIELHSSCGSPIVSNDATFSVPILTLSNLRRLNLTQLSIFAEKAIFEKKVILGSNDDSVSLSLPLANEKYLIRTKIGEIEYDITDEKNDNNDNFFTVKNGNNFFNNTKIAGNDEKLSSSEILHTSTNTPAISISVSPSISQFPSITPSQQLSSTNNVNQGSTHKRQNLPLILGLAIGIPIAVGVLVFCVATYIILCRTSKKDPMQIPAQKSDKTMEQPLNEQELESIV